MRSLCIGLCCILAAMLFLCFGLITTEQGLRELLDTPRPPGVLGFEITSGRPALTFAGRTAVLDPAVWAERGTEWLDRLRHFFSR